MGYENNYTDDSEVDSLYDCTHRIPILPIVSVTANYTIANDAANGSCFVVNSGSDTTITLPSVSVLDKGTHFYIKHRGSHGKEHTVQANATDKIDERTSANNKVILTAVDQQNMQSVHLITDGSEWFVVGHGHESGIGTGGI